MFSSGYRDRMVVNVVSVDGAVFSSVTNFVSPAIHLIDTPRCIVYLKSILDLFDFFTDVSRDLFQKIIITKWKRLIFLF